MQGCWRLATVVGVGITGVMVFQLQLTKLTTPTTVATLGVLKNIATVLFFLNARGESFTKAQELGFTVATVGVLTYACAMRGHRQEFILSGPRYPAGMLQSEASGSIGSLVEQQGVSVDGAPMWGSDGMLTPMSQCSRVTS
mmetsp:Transcript_72057/g.202208  ORF Transcript_72057/g.202208 Transcript_72057/m.202208 type:complete len:141 (+) Transcript_72057:2-424(+)